MVLRLCVSSLTHFRVIGISILLLEREKFKILAILYKSLPFEASFLSQSGKDAIEVLAHLYIFG